MLSQENNCSFYSGFFHNGLLTGASNDSAKQIVRKRKVMKPKDPWDSAHLPFVQAQEFSCSVSYLTVHCHIQLEYATAST